MWPAILSRTRRDAVLLIGVTLSLLAVGLIACRGGTPSPPREVTRIVERTVVITQVITRVVTPIPGRPTSLTLCLREEPSTLDPLNATTNDAQAIRLLLGRVLVGWDERSRPLTQVFERVPTLENGDARIVGEEGPDGHLEVTFRIRPDVRWEDGHLLRAQDFVAAWEAARQGKGTTKIRALAKDVVAIRVVDMRTFVVVLRQGLMTPLYMTYVFGPYPSHAMPTDPTIRWPSFGPYVLSTWERGKGMVFTARSNAVPPPPIPTLNVHFMDPTQEDPVVALIGGRCDVVAPSLLSPAAFPLLEQAKHQNLVQVATVEGPAWVHLDFNTWPEKDRLPFFADVRVRQAVALSVDREALTSKVTYGLGQPMRSWLPPQSWAFEALPALSPHVLDRSRARQLLAEAGWRDADGDGLVEAHDVRGTFWDGEEWQIPNNTPFRVQLVTVAGDDEVERTAQGVVEALTKIGMDVQVTSVKAEEVWKAHSPLRRRTFDMALFSWLPGPDPNGRYLWVGNTICRRADGRVYAAEAGGGCTPGDEELYPAQIPRQANGWRGGNVAGWARAEASLAIYQATARLRPQERASFYLRHQNLFEKDLPVIPFFLRPRLAAWRAGWTNIRLSPFLPITWNIDRWETDK